MKLLPAINIQFPISRLILSGEKTVETRTYAIPEKYVGKDLYFVETPGSIGNFEARVVGVIRFKSCFRYRDKTHFYLDKAKHKVDERSPYAWASKQKWGWVIESVRPLRNPVLAPKKRGIIFTKGIKLP